jgi:hypothetical protein
VLPVLALWALFDTYWRLWVPPIIYDETAYVPTGWSYLHGSYSGPGGNFEHPPLAKLLFGLAETFVGHPSYLAARAVAATCTLATGVVLGLWLARAAGRWVGLLAGAAVVLVPMTILPQATSFGRSAMLDPVAGFFMVGAVGLSWFWFNSSGKQAWLLALGCGGLTGLAAASKENGFLGAVGPVLLGMALCARSPGWLSRMAQGAAAVATATAAFVAMYLPLGNPGTRIRYLVEFQLHHRAVGHGVGFAGRVSVHPPWWTNFWYAGHSLGSAVSTALVGAVLAAIVLRRDRLVWWCVAALGGPVAFHCFVARDTLPFYWVMWMPAVFALAALGGHELVRRARRSGRVVWRVLSAAVAVVVLVTMLGSAIRETLQVATEPREGPAALAGIRHTWHRDGDVLGTGVYDPEVQPYLGKAQLQLAMPADLRSIDTIIIGQPQCHTPSSRDIRALVSTNLASGVLREVSRDRLLRVYIVTGRLHRPTEAEVDAQPPRKLADGC